MQSTGSLWPYRDRKNLKVSRKKMRTVASRSATASSFPLGLIRTLMTSSVICIVLQKGEGRGKVARTASAVVDEAGPL